MTSVITRMNFLLIFYRIFSYTFYVISFFKYHTSYSNDILIFETPEKKQRKSLLSFFSLDVQVTS